MGYLNCLPKVCSNFIYWSTSPRSQEILALRIYTYDFGIPSPWLQVKSLLDKWVLLVHSCSWSQCSLEDHDWRLSKGFCGWFPPTPSSVCAISACNNLHWQASRCYEYCFLLSCYSMILFLQDVQFHSRAAAAIIFDRWMVQCIGQSQISPEDLLGAVSSYGFDIGFYALDLI